MSNTGTKYQADPSHQNIKFIVVFLFQSFPSCRSELVVEFNRGSWKMLSVKNDEILLYGETEIRIKSGEIEKMTVFPISRAMLHSTPAAPGM